MRSFYIVNDLAIEVCFPSKTENLSLSHFIKVIGITKSKILKKHILRWCKCKFNAKKCSSNQKWNNDKCQFEYENPKLHYVCKSIFRILNIVEYLISAYDNSVVPCAETINVADCLLKKLSKQML